jgi:cell division protein FtsI/penicillin-binding protein 2
LDSQSKPNIHFNRIYFIVFALVLFWVILEIRLFAVQIHNHDFYLEQSRIQSAKKILLEARRGEIFDRNEESLATNLIQYDLGVDLNKIRNKDKVAHVFGLTFQRSKSYFLNKLNSKRDFIFLARKVPERRIKPIESLEDPGLVKLPGFRRFYPYGKYGAQVIGITNVDDQGISGLELQYDEQLKGRDGWTFLLVDARRRFGYDVDFPRLIPEPGINMILTLDKNFQTIVEDELDHGVKKYNATYGMAVLMDPNTSQILAMYSSPGFDPNNPTSSTVSQRKNRIIVDIFEPGSTFKIFPAAVLLQEYLKKPDDIVFCENGSYRFYNHIINDSKKYAWLPFNKVIENSSNIGMVKLTSDLSKYTLYKYLKSFGFEAKTGVNLIGESSGILTKPKNFSGLSKAAISFGQEVGVTALQITNAFCAVINGGNLMQPYLIDRILSSEGKIINQSEPMKIRRVISTNVSDNLKGFMLNVVRRGTGKKAAIPGIEVGGKTGTAQVYDLKAKRYLPNQYMASFIGFAPFKQPKYVLAVFLFNPKPYYYGGQVAAPLFSSIMERILNFAPLPDSELGAQIKIAQINNSIPDLKGLPIYAAEEYFEIKQIDYTIQGDGSHILTQSQNTDQIKLTLGIPDNQFDKLPNLKGLTIREALKRIDFRKVRVKITGSGRIIQQSIKPGSRIKRKQELHLYCSNN